MITLEPPVEKESHYNCPHCGTLTDQKPISLYYTLYTDRGSSQKQFSPLTLRQCSRCKQHCLWFFEKLLYPLNGSIAVLPHADLPDDVRFDVEEARMIVGLSPRSSAALLRLALQKLCDHLGAQGRDLDANIRCLVNERRLDPMVQQTLDVIRVVGNEAVHPGVLDLRDNITDVVVLFDMMNEIVEELITRPRRILEKYESLPESARKSAEEKDRKIRESRPS